MKATAATALAAISLALGACGGGEKAANTSQGPQNSAETLRNAAEQSTPEARQVLLNEAERLEGANVTTPPGAPGSPVQQAMENAAGEQATPPAPPRQAVPHKPGDPVPPPTTTPPR